GVIFFIVDACVALLILTEKDKRSSDYRKYLLSLQVFSTLTDVLFNLCVPIVVADSRVIYNAGFIPNQFRTSTFLMVYVILFTEIGSAYFSCAYYRRNSILPQGHLFRWSGWRKYALLLAVRVYAVLSAAMVYYCTLRIDIPDEEIPASLNWVFTKSAHMVLRDNGYFYALLA
ncbi:hypothetical protein PENTCL1PPCAC_15665, partial [Pristionchus entomophagus]